MTSLRRVLSLGQRACAAAFLASLAGASLLAQQVPPAVTTDPPPDAKHPATMRVAAIPSGGDTQNGVLYLAAGGDQHPTLLLLHGLPGNEQNLDVAQAVRRAGWNVLTMHYRGSWGSGGSFSFGHAVADVHAALAWLRDPANADAERIDTARLVLAGHSMGGGLAAVVGSKDEALLGIAMISAWNFGAQAANAVARGEAGRREFERAMAGNLESLVGCTPKTLADEAFARAAEWDFARFAAQLAPHALLLVSSLDGNEPQSKALGAAVRAAGGKGVTEVQMPTDHAYSDHRIALQAAVVNWLDGLLRR